MSQDHIQLICDQLRNKDEVHFAVRLELVLPDCSASKRAKYLAIVMRSDELTEDACRKCAIFGFDILKNSETTIGMRFPVVNGVKLSLYGDGKFMIFSPSDNFSYVFRTVSVQAMWLVINKLQNF